MKKQFNDVKYELTLNVYNRSIFWVLGLMVLFLLINYGVRVSNFQGDVKCYKTTYKTLLEDGEDVEALLQQKVHITEEKDSSGGVTQFIDNTLK